MSLQQMVEIFMDYCISKQLRPKTMKGYEQALRLFIRWVRERYGVDSVEKLKEAHIRAYIVELQKRGKYTFCADDRSNAANHPSHRSDYKNTISNTTINNYLRNIRVFCCWLVENEYIEKSPMRRVKLLPQERLAKSYMEDPEVLKLMKSMDKRVFSEYRDLLVMMVMLDAGTRIGETLSIEDEQLNIDMRSIHLPAEKTKGRRARTVYFSTKTARELKRWIQYRNKNCDACCLFPVQQSGGRLAVRNYEANFRRYMKRSAINKRVTPHTFRNNFAKRCLMNGMDIYTLSRILGHASVTVTEKAYLDVTEEDIKKRYVKFSPVNAIYYGE